MFTLINQIIEPRVEGEECMYDEQAERRRNKNFSSHFIRTRPWGNFVVLNMCITYYSSGDLSNNIKIFIVEDFLA